MPTFCQVSVMPATAPMAPSRLDMVAEYDVLEIVDTPHAGRGHPGPGSIERT